MRATIYARLSQDREGQTSTERQEADCRAWVASHGGTVTHVRVDLGLSGYSGVERPAFQEALQDLLEGRADTLVVWKLDRLSRRGIGQVGALLDDLERTGGRLVAIQDGIDTAQAGSRVVLALLAEMARAESANTGARTRSAKARLADSGRWMGGRPPYGYAIQDRHRLVLNPETAPVAREMARRAAEGETLVSIARDLNARGLHGYHGRPWSSPKLSGVLRSPAMVGWLPRGPRNTPHRDEAGEPVVVAEEPLLTVAEWRAVLDRLDARRPTGWTGRPPSFLLTGRIRCGACGGPMASNGRSGSRTAAYRCRGNQEERSRCPGNTVATHLADDWVAARLLARLAALDEEDPLLEAVARRWVVWKAPDTAEERTVLELHLADLEARLAVLEDAYYLRGELPADRFRGLSAQLRADLERSRALLDSLTVPGLDLGPLLDPELGREAWEAASLEDRRAILGLAVDRIIVTPSGGGATGGERLALEWAAMMTF